MKIQLDLDIGNETLARFLTHDVERYDENVKPVEGWSIEHQAAVDLEDLLSALLGDIVYETVRAEQAYDDEQLFKRIRTIVEAHKAVES